MSCMPTRGEIARGVALSAVAAVAIAFAGCASTNNLHVAQEAEVEPHIGMQQG